MDVIATRTFTRAEGSGTYDVLIGKPVEVRHDEWRCDTEIRGPDGTTRDKAFGIDAIQALMLSFDVLRNNLSSISPPVHWHDMTVDIAFPRFIPIALGEDFYRRMESHIDGAIDEFNERHENR